MSWLLAYGSGDDLSVYDDRPDHDSVFGDPIYDDELDEDCDKEFDAPIWDIYEDDDQTCDQIFDIPQDCGFDDKIIFDDYQVYEEETPQLNEQIDLVDGADLTDVTLKGVVET